MAARARCGDRLIQHRRGGKKFLILRHRVVIEGSTRHTPEGFAVKGMLVRRPGKCVRTKSDSHGSGAAFDLKFPSEFAATDRGIADRRHQSLRPIRSEHAPAMSSVFAGPMIVAAVQAGTSTAPYRGRPMWADQLQVCRIVETCEVLQRGLDLKAYPIGATAFRVGRQRKWDCLRRAGRALSPALHLLARKRRARSSTTIAV
jgi:hypothetical protein